MTFTQNDFEFACLYSGKSHVIVMQDVQNCIDPVKKIGLGQIRYW